MKRRFTWTPSETEPARAEVLTLQGLPPGAEPPRTAALLDSALAAYLEAAEPRAVTSEISREAFVEVYRGEGRNAAASPLEAIVPRADGLVLFTATAGGRVTAAIRALFARNEPALAVMLDSVASAAADRLAELLRLHVQADAGNGRRVLAYSPGYCGWHVSGQRALFAALGPEEIGVTLNASFLMEPLKSVSGVLVGAAPEVHRFAPVFPFCADCRDKPCRERMASLRA